MNTWQRYLSASSLALLAGAANANNAPEGPVTFTKHVAPILAENCVTCHRPGDIGPMSLMTFDEVRPWVKAIQQKVVHDKSMPPWHSVDPRGTFANDRRLTEDQIATIDRWIQQGAKQGNPADMPAMPVFSDAWRMGEPDHIITLQPQDIPAEGPDVFLNLFAKFDFPEDKWVKAVEILPSNRKVVHHVIVIGAEQMEMNQGTSGINGWIGGWAAGTNPIEFPKGMARKIKGGDTIIANMHYHPYGEAGADETKVGFHFYDGDEEPLELYNQWVLNATFEIPPGDSSHEVRASHLLEQDAMLVTVAPHMHFRGKDMIISAVFPDGTEKKLIEVPKYDFNWQTIYECAEPIRLPKGTELKVVGHFDNSTANAANPDPTKAIIWGPESVDEMLIGIIDLVKIPDETAASGD
jgi:mono/diheme cytochrome c family protein